MNIKQRIYNDWEKKKMSKIVGHDVLILGPGYSITSHGSQIKKFIKKKNITTIGLNHITDFIVPDFHIWGDRRRFIKFGHHTNKKSVPVFIPSLIENKLIKYEMKIKKFIRLYYKNVFSQEGRRIKRNNISESRQIDTDFIKCKNKRIQARFKTVGCIAVLWCYLWKASNIYIAGMDGYSLYEKGEYEKGEARQHFYGIKKGDLGWSKDREKEYIGTGYTDLVNYYEKGKGENDLTKDTYYRLNVEKDISIYNSLKAINKYGVNFKILTPTVYNEFYDLSILKKYE